MTPPSAIIAPAYQGIDANRILANIASVESRNNPKSENAKTGARGLYQFKPETWADETDLPFDDAFDPVKAFPVARRHLFRLRWSLLEARIEPTVYNLALAWERGADGVILHKYQPKEAKDRAQRVENLYLDR